MESYTDSGELNVKQQDFIAQELDDSFDYVYVSTGQLFVNFLIDFTLMRLTLTYALTYVIFSILATFAPEYTSDLVYGSSKAGLYSITFLTIIFSFLVYYTICEKLIKGVALGKLISGTKAIREDSSDLPFKDALLPILSRIVPCSGI